MTRRPGSGATARTLYTEAYDSACRSLFIPEVQFSALPEGTMAVPLRGSAYTLAVVRVADSLDCLGWILREAVSP